ncbi:afadin-like isoform X17 [Acipenser ruthenus]|uniref:afadin-like isoform X17 n=1 Tax=Acipenser ruthenus TaxID=7906 RepID=UPI002740B1E5|nr:afadin-like isoform X17 [Acipenser ruthenus]
MSGSREDERRKLADIINHWNANRLDLFEISQPTEDLEFHGVMRFYFQDRVAGNFATKCIRVSSTATTQDVIETLAEKFRPDMRMLSSPKYSLYEVHVSGERRLDLDEKPLVVQLNWNKDDREGRFVLKNENDIIPKKVQSNGPEKQEKEGVIQNFKRTLSKKEKKKEKRREKEAFLRVQDGDEYSLHKEDGENSRLAAEVYKDMPETSFTRTISNPDVVIKRRRQQRLEQRIQEFGRPDSGGTLKIYADSLKPNIPYKTILLSNTDTADFAVAEALEKYGLEKENPSNYCIARVMLPPGSQHSDDNRAWETILEDAERPLQIFREWPGDKETLVFQLKKRPLDYVPKKALKPDEKVPRGKSVDGYLHGSLPPEKLPYLVELSPGRGNHYTYYSCRRQEDGSDSRNKPKLYRLQMRVTEVGSDKTEENSIQLFGPGIQPHHCDLTHMDSMVTVTPQSFDAETYVDGQRIADTTMLRSGMKVQFGSYVFKFVDPSYDHGMIKRSMDAGPMVKGQRHKSGSVPETTFELDGDIHSGTSLQTSKSSSRLDIERSTLSERGMVKPMVREQQQDYRKQESRSQDGQRPELMLPASIEFRESSEDAFLSAVINYTNSSTVYFKLSPTYILYMTCRYVLSSQYRPDMSPSERTHKVIAIVNKMVSTMEGVIQEIPEGDQKQKNIAGALAFWMANSSELLNFIKQDKDLSRVTLDAQDVLAHLVQMAFKYLVHCLQSDLNNYMPAFLEDPEEQYPQRPKLEDVLHTLTGTMSLLRRCRVNAALTIQLFSQLFHFINMWLFNKLVTEPDSELCSHYWGAIVRQQLGHIEAWAEKQGLELAADCHLSRIVQATTLLTMDKYSMQDVSNINSTCFKLNSLQLQALLQNYHCAPDEPNIPPDLIENVVAVAENTADELARSDSREVHLEEDPDLQLPFLLPEDGYSCDVVRNIPNGFQEFLEPLCQRGYCRLTPHPHSPGTWTIYFEGADYEHHFSTDSTELPMLKDPEIVTVTLKKHNGMGLSIVAAKGAGQEKLGIYVKSVVKGGAADIDGRLAAGDQLLSVDGRSLVGLSQEKAAELMTRTGSVVTLEVAKQGAIYHGLATLLNQPSPMMQRASDRGRGSGKPRPKSEGFELYNNSAQNGSPESPQMPWGEYPEPNKTSGEERLLKNRADHRSSPNVANQAHSPGGKPVNSDGPKSKITSVSTGNLYTDEQQPPPRPEVYPIPTQTYARDYFTFPASKSQDRMGPGPGQQRQNYEDRLPGQPDDHHSSMSIQRVTRSQEQLCDDRVAYQPERMRQEEIVQMQQREMEYQRERGNGEHWNHQVSSSVESSTSSQEQLNYSASSSKVPNHKSGAGRWKTPGPPNSAPVAVSQPILSDLPPPPPPPPPVHYTDDFDTQADLPLPPPPPAGRQLQQAVSAAAAAADRKKRDEQQRWYEKEKARLEEERDRKRREQDKKLSQVHIPPGPGVPPHPNHHQQQQSPLSPMPIQHQQHQQPPSPMPLQQQQQYHPPPMMPQQPPWIEKPSSLPHAPPPRQDTVIRELLPQQQPRTIERRDLQYIVSKEDLTSGDSLSPDPWKRDAREKMEKQQQLHIVDMLNKEIQELQAKPERTAEENDRLRKLMLEWQFQKRLQESKENEEDEEEEDDEDVDTMLIMQRLEAEKRARLQDEERRRKQQLEEIRKREAEERAKQEEERRRREEERSRREAEEKRRQEEEYYNRLEAERRRQHNEAERKLLTPDEPGLYRPPLPRDYELPPPPPPSANTPPPPPQRNTSYLKTQVFSPDTVYTAKFVSCNDDEEEEDSSIAGFNSYTGTTAGVVGLHEVYRDSRDKWVKSGQDQDGSLTGEAPESMTFKERQRLFSQGQDVSNKVKASRKLMELENELNTK